MRRKREGDNKCKMEREAADMRQYRAPRDNVQRRLRYGRGIVVDILSDTGRPENREQGKAGR